VAEFPFVYLNQADPGTDGFGTVGSIWIGFDEPLTADHLRWMIDACPEPLAGTFYADEALFHCESGSCFEDALFRIYGDEVAAPVVAARFAGALEEWGFDVHDGTPIAFLLGPGTPFYGRVPVRPRYSRPVVVTEWALWSAGRLPDVIEWFEDYLDTFEDLPPTEYEQVDEDWPALPMNRLTLSFIVDRLPGANAVWDAYNDPDLADRVEDLRARLEYY
jgi:hypothetical protein